jgi:hypothetical protein
MKKSISIVASTLLAGTVFLVGCGSDSASTPPASLISGSASDGYIQNGRVLNKKDELVGKTDKEGKYSGKKPTDAESFTILGGSYIDPDTNETIIVTDKSTGAPFEGELSARYLGGNVNIHGPSTVLDNMLDTNLSLNDANLTAIVNSKKVKVAKLLDINESMIDVDPVYLADNGTPAEKLLAKKASVAGTIFIKQIENLAKATESSDYAAIYKKFAVKAEADQNMSTAFSQVVDSSTITKGNVASLKAAASTLQNLANIESNESVDDIMGTIDAISASFEKAIVANDTAKLTTLATDFSDTAKVNQLIVLQKELVKNADANKTVRIIDVVNYVIDNNKTANIDSVDANDTTVLTSVAKTETEIESENNATATAIDIVIDKLVLKNSQFVYGETNVSVTGGEFAVTVEANSTALKNISFTLEDDANEINKMLENGDSKKVTLGLQVSSSTDLRVLTAVIDNVTVSKSSDVYTIDTNSSSKLYAEATKTSGAPVDAEVNVGTGFITSSNSLITLDVSALLSNLSGTNASTVVDQLNKDGSYVLSLYISGVDGLTGFTKTTEPIEGKFNGTVYGVTGTLTVGAGSSSTTTTPDTGTPDTDTGGVDDGTPIITLGATALTAKVGETNTTTITVNPVVAPEIASLSTSVATVSYADGVITVTGVSAGTATIDIYANESHSTIAVTVEAAGSSSGDSSYTFTYSDTLEVIDGVGNGEGITISEGSDGNITHFNFNEVETTSGQAAGSMYLMLDGDELAVVTYNNDYSSSNGFEVVYEGNVYTGSFGIDEVTLTLKN